MSVENKTEIELLRILYKNSGKSPSKNMTFKKAYPLGIERKYYFRLRSYFKPLFTFVKDYLDENGDRILRGDSSEFRLDAIPGDSFDDMIYSLENWVNVYMPDLSNSDDKKFMNTIYVGINKTAEEVKKFNDKEFSDNLVKAIHVNLPINAEWWGKMMKSWSDNNYALITSNARNYIDKINNLVENAVVNGQGMMKLKRDIEKATKGLSEAHCRLLARDQIGKLNGLINQAQMEELGLKLYVWETSMDERVRDSHRPMEGLLCRWDNSTVCSYDGGKSWVSRPSGAVQLHPGQDFQCRCSALVYNPELIAQLEGKPMEIIPLSKTKDIVLYNSSLVPDNLKVSPILPEEVKDLVDLYKLADEVKSEFVDNVNNIISNVGKLMPLIVKECEEKSSESVMNYLIEKQKDYERHGGTYSRFYNPETNEYNPRYVDDVLRTVILFKTLMDLQRAFFGFLDDDKTVRIENNFASENEVKYRNILINVIMSNGLVGEVELNTIANFVAYEYGGVLNDVYDEVCYDVDFIPLADGLKKILKNLFEFSDELSEEDVIDVEGDIFDFDYEPFADLIKRDVEKLIPDYKKAFEKGLIDEKTDKRFRELCQRIGVKI